MTDPISLQPTPNSVVSSGFQVDPGDSHGRFSDAMKSVTQSGDPGRHSTPGSESSGSRPQAEVNSLLYHMAHRPVNVKPADNHSSPVTSPPGAGFRLCASEANESHAVADCVSFDVRAHPVSVATVGSFRTQDGAAKAALTVANPQSIAQNREFGGVIYRDASGRYGYTRPIPGKDQTFDLSQTPNPPGTTLVGDYHTHADYSTLDLTTYKAIRTRDPSKDEFDSDNFSSTDKLGYILRGGRGSNPDYRGYLGTPSGKFKVYNPSTGTVRILQ
jgi:hypothetical protein